MENPCYNDPCGLAIPHEHGGEWYNLPPVKAAMDGACPLGGKHAGVKIYRRRMKDLFRKTIWWVCIYCDEEQEVVS